MNARFRHRQVTGVERYARELTARLPDDVDQLEPDKRFDRPPLGHIWEQTVLPREIDTDEVLWSPCNTGPIVLKRHIVTIHDISPTEHPEWFSPAYARWLDLLAKRFVRHALHIITDSEFTKDRLCDRLGADADRVSIVHPGIDTAFFSGQASLNEEQRARLGVAEGPYLLSLATHEPRKNLAALINAFEIVHETHPDVTLVLAGDAGRSEIFARDDWNPSRGATAVNQIGYVPDELLPGLYGGAEALVYVPHYEGFGLPPVEAAAAGTQSVLADIPVLRELGLPATWVDPNDVESIAAGIAERLAGERVDLTAMQSVALGFSWDRSFESLRDAFAALGVDLGSAP